MPMRIGAAAIIAVAFAVPFADLGGDLLSCVAEGSCDGAPVGTGTVRQPAAAWSALALSAVGIALLDRNHSRGSLVGGGLLAASIGSFWYHATLTTWAGVVDAAAVAAVAAAFAVGEWAPDRRLAVAAWLSTGVAALGAASGVSVFVTTAYGVAAAAGIVLHVRERSIATLALAAVVYGAGAVFWLTGPHALWHVLAAAATGLLALHVRPYRRSAPTL